MSDFKLEPDREHLAAHIEEFGRRIKLSGTPEELESFRYLEREMASFGYRTQLLFHDAYISLPGHARAEANGESLRCITHSMSVATPSGGIGGQLVYVGDGDEAAFASTEVGGKIVLVDGIATEEVTALASARGAAGQLHVSPNEHLYEMCVSPVWGSPSHHTRPKLPSTVVCTIARDDGARLRAQCLEGKTVRVSLWAEVDTGWRKTPLLVADLQAENETGDAAPFVLFSGHHDTWHHGVMDNGGANATMLEAARLLATRRSLWRRGLRLCFWSGHSHGRYSGSAWYADECWEDLDRRCVAHVNVDSTGGEGASVLTNSAVIDELKSVAADAVEAVTGQRHAGRRHSRAADQSFWGIGIPSMFGSVSHQPPGPVKMLTALGWWWHTPHDTAEHIDLNNLQRDTAIVLRVLWRLLTAAVLPLDYAAFAASMREELLALRDRLGDRLDIANLLSRLDALERAAQAVDSMAKSAGEDALDQINQTLMRVSRLLVPLNYTTGNRFSHDSALPHPAWPSLAGLRELASLPQGSPDQPFYAVHARQCRNLAAHALREAHAALAVVIKLQAR
jgi:hypothetical protein